MKRNLIFLFLLCGAYAAAQTTVTVTLTVASDATVALETARLAGAATNYALGAAIGAADATLQLTSAAGVPAAGQLVVDSEAINFTYSGSGNTLALTKRGATITTAAAHAQGAVVRVLTYPTINALAKWALFQYFRGVLLQSPTAAMQTAQAQVTTGQNAVESAIATAVQ